MAITVIIDGAEGTTGLQIFERLANDSEIEVLRLEDEVRKSLPHRVQAATAANLTLMCLPDDASRELANAVPNNVRLCDASTAHRTNPEWVYGLPELGNRREQLKKATRVAVPGCHASGFLMLAAPLVEKGLLAPSATLACHSLTGYSGGGKKMIAQYQDPARPAGYDAPRAYGLGMQHKHLPEMRHIAGLNNPPLFCPIVADFYSGMLVSIPLDASLLTRPMAYPAELAAFYADYYSGEALVTVSATLPDDGTLAANALATRDDIELFVQGNGAQMLLMARYDNLGKGASGAAVQCMNLMLGRDELTGLHLPSPAH